MKVLMFGWEFPPYNTGGLGTACYGLTKGLAKKGASITFVMPHPHAKADYMRIVSPSRNVAIKRVDSLLKPYMNSSSYSKAYQKKFSSIYGKSLFEEVDRYTRAVKDIIQDEDFDVIHCHDWMTFKAGIKAKSIRKKPLVVQVHATEFDRTGNNNVNQYVYNIEREGMHKADAIIAVSNFTKNKIVEHYGIHPDKVHVVHNAVEFANGNIAFHRSPLKDKNKIVLFLGRFTLQKGPEYFLYAAKKVLEYEKDVKFVMAGSGDMEGFVVEKAAELGISDKVIFTGFLRGADIDMAYRMADLYIMPSVSEPFGITPLESLSNNTPVIISKQSGVSEVLQHCLKVDFWDVHETANKILGVLRYGTLHEALQQNGHAEVKKFRWEDSAEKCLAVYHHMLKNKTY